MRSPTDRRACARGDVPIAQMAITVPWTASRQSIRRDRSQERRAERRPQNDDITEFVAVSIAVHWQRNWSGGPLRTRIAVLVIGLVFKSLPQLRLEATELGDVKLHHTKMTNYRLVQSGAAQGPRVEKGRTQIVRDRNIATKRKGNI